MKISYIDRQTGTEKLETPPGEGFLKFLYQNPLGKIALHGLAKRKFLSAWYGKRMNKASSVKKIAGFVDQLKIDMTESVKSMADFTSFNDFFYRKLKPGARPIGEGLVSPGDGKLLAFARASEVGKFYVKGSTFTLDRFLANEKLATRFANGPLLILRLAPNDYHRYHFPWAGTTTASQKISGWYYSVSPYAVLENFGRVFCENKREYTLLDTPDRGQMVLSPVGATMVGSIKSTYRAWEDVQKGAEMGYFAFGGSTVVMLMEPNQFSIDEDLLANTRAGKETFVQMGEKIGE